MWRRGCELRNVITAPEAQHVKDMDFSAGRRQGPSPAHPLTLVQWACLGFLHQLWENKCLLFQAIGYKVICYSSKKNLNTQGYYYGKPPGLQEYFKVTSQACPKREHTHSGLVLRALAPLPLPSEETPWWRRVISQAWVQCCSNNWCLWKKAACSKTGVSQICSEKQIL